MICTALDLSFGDYEIVNSCQYGYCGPQKLVLLQQMGDKRRQESSPLLKDTDQPFSTMPLIVFLMLLSFSRRMINVTPPLCAKTMPPIFVTSFLAFPASFHFDFASVSKLHCGYTQLVAGGVVWLRPAVSIRWYEWLMILWSYREVGCYKCCVRTKPCDLYSLHPRSYSDPWSYIHLV